MTCPICDKKSANCDCTQLEISQHERIDELETALRRIAKWYGEFPETGKFWNEEMRQNPMSYSACYGSNGERDFMRNIAKKALNQS